jgi:hypothetical protein
MYKILGGDGKEYGPIPAETLRQWVAEGRANEQTQVMIEGTTEWVALGSLVEFAGAPSPLQPHADASPEALPSGLVDRAAALRLAVPPGWALTIVGILGVLMCIAMLILLVGFGEGRLPGGGMFGSQPTSEAQRLGRQAGLYSSLIGGIAWAAFIAFAGGRLRELKSWGLVLAAGILCVIPCCGTQFPLCFLSGPVGVWVIVIICLNSVKPAFK